MDENAAAPGPEGTTPPPPPQTPPPLRSAVPPVIPSPVVITMPPQPPRRGGGWKVLSFILLGLIAVWIVGRVVIHSVAGVAAHAYGGADVLQNLEEVVIERTNTDNKIAVVEVSGIISSGEVLHGDTDFVGYIKEQFKAAESDPDVKAVILKVNSPGGEVLASDEVNRIIRKFEDKSGKPVVVSMGALAASGGYYISAPCRWIVANELTITGSIGVIMHNYNYRLLFDKIGVRPEVIKSGRFKDMLSGEKEPDDDKLTAQEIKDRNEEEKMVQGLIDETFDKFKEVVKTGREWAAKQNAGEGRTLVGDWTNYADGRILSGKSALDYGFVDELGNFDTAVKRARTLTGLQSANLVEYRLPMDLIGALLSHVVGQTPAPALKVDFGIDAPKLQAGVMYFITPMAVPH
jgi:protease-4